MASMDLLCIVLRHIGLHAQIRFLHLSTALSPIFHAILPIHGNAGCAGWCHVRLPDPRLRDAAGAGQGHSGRLHLRGPAARAERQPWRIRPAQTGEHCPQSA